jgi:hypothetical protein
MKDGPCDLIGDVHGEAEILRQLLELLGYRETRGGYRHPNRKVIFLGDYVDRGPAIRETLQIIRRMVEDDSAIALCGNHEFDLLLSETREGADRDTAGSGGSAMHARTYAEFADRKAELDEWLRWFQTLPLYLDLPKLRAVHACWDSRSIAALGEHRCVDNELLGLVGDPLSAEAAAVGMLLAGPEIPLPPGLGIAHPTGCPQKRMRVRWWKDGRGKTYREACIARHGQGPEVQIPSRYNSSLVTPDPDDARPVFFGHYWMPPVPIAPIDSRFACLDFSVASGGPLVAYRWDGKTELRSEKFVACTSVAAMT